MSGVERARDQQKSVMYLGVGLFPFRVAGDKNFQLELARELERQGTRTVVVSIAVPYEPVLAQSQRTHFISPPFHGKKPGQFYYEDPEGVVIAYHHVHGALRQTLELVLALVCNMRVIRRLIRQEGVSVVHWSDSSMVLPVLRWVVGHRVPVVASALRWVPRGSLADRARACALSAASLVITSTEAAANALRRLAPGLSKSIFIAPWGSTGVAEESVRPTSASTGSVRLLWAGFIQQIGRDDFERTIALAKRVTAARPDIEFDFCFKPESITPADRELASQRVRVFTGGADFRDTLTQYDGFLSPVFDRDSCLAPPLTWVEVLSASLPIITLKTPGVEELLGDGEGGFIFEAAEGLERWLAEQCSVALLATMRPKARAVFEARYRMDEVAANYQRAYRKATEGQAGHVKEYRARQAYQDEHTAATYDVTRFRSRRGAWVDRRERSLMMMGLQMVLQPGDSSTVLDIPTGTGRLTNDLLATGYTATSGDISQEMLTQAERSYTLSSIRRFAGSVICDVEQLPFADDSFDAVVCLRLAGHLPPRVLEAAIGEFTRVARQGAVVMFVRDSPLPRLKRFVRRKLAGGAPDPMWFPMRRERIEGLPLKYGWEVRLRRSLLPLVSESVLYVLAPARGREAAG